MEQFSDKILSFEDYLWNNNSQIAGYQEYLEDELKELITAREDALSLQLSAQANEFEEKNKYYF